MINLLQNGFFYVPQNDDLWDIFDQTLFQSDTTLFGNGTILQIRNTVSWLYYDLPTTDYSNQAFFKRFTPSWISPKERLLKPSLIKG